MRENDGGRTWIHPLHSVGKCAVGIGIILPGWAFAQAIGVRDVTEGVQVVASLAWVCDDCMRGDEGEEKTCCGGEEGRGLL